MGINHRAVSGFREFSALNKLGFGRTVKSFEMPYVSYPRPLWLIKLKISLTIILSLILFPAYLFGQTKMDTGKIHGKWKYSYQFFDPEDSITVDWPIETLVFEENGTFIIQTDSEELSGKYEFMDSSIVLKEVSKNGIKQEGQEILFLSNLDSLTLTIQARMETGIMYVEYEKE